MPSPVSVIEIDTPTYKLSVSGGSDAFFRYNDIPVGAPAIEIAGALVPLSSRDLVVQSNREVGVGAREVQIAGSVVGIPSARILFIGRIVAGSPIFHFSYRLSSTAALPLTKSGGQDLAQYLRLPLQDMSAAELRLSEFIRLFDSPVPTRYRIEERHFANRQAAFGPILLFGNGSATGLVFYEHGSEAPNAFLEFWLTPEREAILRGVKGTYWDGQVVEEEAPWETPWLGIGAVPGDEEALARTFRGWMLKRHWRLNDQASDLVFRHASAHQQQEERWRTEVEIAAALGAEVFLLEQGWQDRAGDWRVSPDRFPGGIASLHQHLDSYGLRLGLTMTPGLAAISSEAWQRFRAWRATRRGVPYTIAVRSATEAHQLISVVSPYADAFAERAIQLLRETGASYLLWRVTEQYGSDAASHGHGSVANALEERGECFAFLMGKMLVRMSELVRHACPGTRIDYVFEDRGACFGLELMAQGRCFLDYPPTGIRHTAEAEIDEAFRMDAATLRRLALPFDRWIPSVLLPTFHRIEDLPENEDPRASQDVAIASIALGHTGLRGDLLALSSDGAEYIGTALAAFKRIRREIAESFPLREGTIGGNPEVHEKLSANSGKGAVCLFATAPGLYRYVTQHKVAQNAIHNDGIRLVRDAGGRALIEAQFLPGQNAKWIFFGAV